MPQRKHLELAISPGKLRHDHTEWIIRNAAGEYWYSQTGWAHSPTIASIYTQAQRDKFTLPAHGYWVLLHHKDYT